MEFKIGQLSPSNLASIYNAAYVDAKVNENGAYCDLTVNYKTCVSADAVSNNLTFSYAVYLDDTFTPESANYLVNLLNLELSLVKVYALKKSNKEDHITMVFRYDHMIFDYLSINGKTLINIHRLFEQKLDQSGHIYRKVLLEINQRN